jgi:hypothetical protein
MSTPIKLYFDKVYNDGNNAETFDSVKIYYNFERIDKLWFHQFIDSLASNNASSAIMQAGRFIAILSLTFSRNEQGMVLMDLHNDENFAESIAIQRQDLNERERFMKIFYSISETYEEDFDKFELVEGLPPEYGT